MPMTITWTDRRGNSYSAFYVSRTEAMKRLNTLHSEERHTRRCAPTDSGDTRFTANAEATAIRKELITFNLCPA